MCGCQIHFLARDGDATYSDRELGMPNPYIWKNEDVISIYVKETIALNMYVYIISNVCSYDEVGRDGDECHLHLWALYSAIQMV